MKLLCGFLFFVTAIQYGYSQSYRDMENMYQADADIVRIHHFDYYAQLLTEYYEKNGKYPFQNEKEYPIYVFILTSFQENYFEDANPYQHYTVNDTHFFEELSNGIGRIIDEKYDPQKVPADARPNMYIYMVDGDNFYFAIHLYNSNPFTKNIDKYYNKMELSNEDNGNNKIYTYETLKNDERYIKLLKQNAVNQAFFDRLDEQYQNDSKE